MIFACLRQNRNARTFLDTIFIRRSDCLYYLLHEELVVRQGIEEKYASSTINIVTLFTHGLYVCKTSDSLIAD